MLDVLHTTSSSLVSDFQNKLREIVKSGGIWSVIARVHIMLGRDAINGETTICIGIFLKSNVSLATLVSMTGLVQAPPFLNSTLNSVLVETLIFSVSPSSFSLELILAITELAFNLSLPGGTSKSLAIRNMFFRLSGPILRSVGSL